MPVGAAVSLHTDRADVGQQHHRELPHVAVESGSRELLASDGVRLAQDGQSVLINRADDADRQTGTGERVPPHDLGGKAEVQANLPYFVLEQGAQRLHKGELEVVGQTTDVVVALDVRGTGAAAGLHDVGVERPLNQELDGLTLSASLSDEVSLGGLEHADELPTDDLALGLRVTDAGERFKEPRLGVDDDEADAGGGNVVALDLLGLSLAQETVVDEDARELVADSAMDESRGNG